MNYVQRLRAALAPKLPDCDDTLIDLYVLLGLMYSDMGVIASDVHNAWAVWRNKTNPEHPAIVPFEQLSPEVQALDDKYVDAIVAAVREARQ